ncbi:unnamed protein product [Symbiodinium pilosum]|uniref:Uncharacterized protein n=1 Tax=Symbiodinium pilosum TaxID=2952 RepID=A0A812YBN6_SYMPI|nr:unnamed protein product [Symbiodinium pilosum]
MLRDRQHAEALGGACHQADHREESAKRRKTTAESSLPVLGPHLPDFQVVEVQEMVNEEGEDEEEDDVVTLPSAMSLPCLESPEKETIVSSFPAADMATSSSIPVPVQADAPEATGEVHPEETDSDSDYRPGPSEDPLWERRQAILNKLNKLNDIS